MYYISTLKQELSTAKTYEYNRLDDTSTVDRHRCHVAVKVGVFDDEDHTIRLDDTSTVDRHRCHVAVKVGEFDDEDHTKLHTLYWLPKLHKRSYKSRFIASSSSCTTTCTGLSILLTPCITAIKNMSLNIAQQFMKEMVKNILVC